MMLFYFLEKKKHYKISITEEHSLVYPKKSGDISLMISPKWMDIDENETFWKFFSYSHQKITNFFHYSMMIKCV